MLALADVIIALVVAGLAVAVFRLCGSFQAFLTVLAPCFASVAALWLSLAIAGIAIGPAVFTAGGVGTFRGRTLLILVLLVGAGALGIATGMGVARALERRTFGTPDSPFSSQAKALRRVRRLRLTAIFGLLLLGPLVWHEHRFWRAMELAYRAPEGPVKRNAVYILGELGDARAIPLLKRLGAIPQLSSMGERGKRALLEYTRDDPDLERRSLALAVLCGPFPAVSPFEADAAVRDEVMRALEAGSGQMRLVAAQCVAKAAGEASAAVAHLKRLLDDPDLVVRTTSAQELGRLGDKSGFESMIAIVRDASLASDTRCRAAMALAKISDEGAFEPLRDALRSGSGQENVEACALHALQELFPGWNDPRHHGLDPNGPVAEP